MGKVRKHPKRRVQRTWAKREAQRRAARGETVDWRELDQGTRDQKNGKVVIDLEAKRG